MIRSMDKTPEVIALVERSIRNYFQEINFNIGEERIKDKKNIKLVLNTSISEAADIAHKMLETRENEKPFGNYKYIMSILNCCHKVEVPIHFAGGILILHLMFVDGLEV